MWMVVVSQQDVLCLNSEMISCCAKLAQNFGSIALYRVFLLAPAPSGRQTPELQLL